MLWIFRGSRRAGAKGADVRGIRNVTRGPDLAILKLYALALCHLICGAKHWRSYTRLAT